MSNEPIRDHGQFVITVPAEIEQDLVRKSIDSARVNPKKPGHHWTRIPHSQISYGMSISIFHMYHVDLNLGVLEITETQNGVETARRTMRLETFAEGGWTPGEPGGGGEG